MEANKVKVYEDKIYTVGNLTQGQDAKQTLIRCYQTDESEEDNLVQIPEFEANVYTDIVELNYDSNKHKDYDPDFDNPKKNEIANLVVAMNNGRLILYGLNPNLCANREIEVINTHFGSIRSLKRNHDSSIMISAGRDGVIFVYRVTDAPNKNVGAWSKKVKNMRERNE